MSATDPATPDAVRDLLAAQQRLLEAIEFDTAHGVSAETIASFSHAVVSRPLVQEFVRAIKCRAGALAALRSANLDRYVAVHIVGAFGRERRRVVMTLGLDPAELDVDPQSLLGRIADALAMVGIAMHRKGYEIVGHRRRAAAEALGLTVPPDDTRVDDASAFVDGDEFDLAFTQRGGPNKTSTDLDVVIMDLPPAAVSDAINQRIRNQIGEEGVEELIAQISADSPVTQDEQRD